MALNGIDISNWQAGIDLTAVDCDFAILKANQGTGYLSDDYYRQVNQCRSIGLLYGTYIYVGGGDAIGEADYYVDIVADTVGEGVLAVDWEEGENSAWGDLDYLRTVIARIIERTGIVPMLYCGASDYPWDIADEFGCPRWVAQYADNNPTGYQDSPWNEGAYQCDVRQYSSSGYIDGYGGRLDIDKYYGDEWSWRQMAGQDMRGDERIVQLFGSNGTDAQRWIPHHEGEYVRLENVACGKYLDVAGAGTDNGTIVQVYPANGTDAQLFRIKRIEGGYYPDYVAPYEILPKVDESKRIDAVSGLTDDGTRIQLFDANGTRAQQFYIADNGDGTWALINNGMRKTCLDVAGGGA